MVWGRSRKRLVARAWLKPCGFHVLELLEKDCPRKLECCTGVRILPGKSKEIVGIWGGGGGEMVKKVSSRSRTIMWKMKRESESRI